MSKSKDKGKPPAFQFYAQDYLVGTTKLSLAERGAYVDCLAYQWEAGGLDDDIVVLARIMRCTPTEAKKVWPKVSAKFERGADGLLWNARMEAVRTEQDEYHDAKARAGKLGGQAKARNTKYEPSDASSSGVADRLANPSSSSSSSVPLSKNESGMRAPVIPPDDKPVHRGPKHHGPSLMGGMSSGTAAVVALDDTGRVLEIPESWARRVRNDYRLSHGDVDEFARWLGARLRAAGGVVEDGGKRFQWLDARIAEWRSGRRSEAVEDAGVRRANAFLAEQARSRAETAKIDPALVVEGLRAGRAGR